MPPAEIPKVEPELTFRCSVHSAWLDRAVPTLLLISTVGGGFVVVDQFLRRAPGAMDSSAGVAVAVVLAVSTFFAFRLYFGTHNEIALYRDRLILDPHLRGPARGRVQIHYDVVSRLWFDGTRIRITYRNDVHFDMRPTKLQATEAWQTLEHLVGAANPSCVVERPD